MEWLFSWEVTSVVVSIFLSIGLGVLSLDDFKLAKTCFFFAAADAMGGMVMWGIKTSASPLTRTVAVFLCTGAVGVLTSQSFRYVESKRIAKQTPPSRPSKAITKTDGFTILVPIDTANRNMPIPLDENAEDPHAKFYRTLTFSITDRHPNKASGYLMLQEDQLFSEAGRPKFLWKLIEVYIFDALFHMSRESYGIELSGGRVTPLEDKAVIPPDVVSSSTDHVIADLSERQLLTKAVEISLKNFPMHMPKGTNISFGEHVERQAVLYVIRMEKPGFFKFEITVRPIGNSNEGVLPDGFQTQAAKTVKTYDLIVAMESVIQVTGEDGFEPDRYVTWTQDTFSELRRRMTF